MYTCIVVGTDGSDRALEAVRTAGHVAERYGVGELHVVTSSHLLSEPEMANIRSDLPKEFHDLVSPDIDAIGRFDQAQGALPMGIKVFRYERTGDPADGILSVAEEIGADLIVVGARGLGAVERFLRGSVSTKVAHHSPCDVLIVEHDD